MGVCTSRVSVCSIAIRPNRKHLNCKAIYSLWHRVTSSWVGLQRACVQPSSAGEETFTLTPSTWIENLWKLRKWFGWRCFFHLFSHLGTWEVCERVRVQRGEVWSRVCVCMYVRACPRTREHPPRTYTPFDTPHLTPHVIFTTHNLRWQPARFTCTVRTCVRTGTWAVSHWLSPWWVTSVGSISWAKWQTLFQYYIRCLN